MRPIRSGWIALVTFTAFGCSKGAGMGDPLDVPSITAAPGSEAALGLPSLQAAASGGSTASPKSTTTAPRTWNYGWDKGAYRHEYFDLSVHLTPQWEILSDQETAYWLESSEIIPPVEIPGTVTSRTHFMARYEPRGLGRPSIATAALTTTRIAGETIDPDEQLRAQMQILVQQNPALVVDGYSSNRKLGNLETRRANFHGDLEIPGFGVIRQTMNTYLAVKGDCILQFDTLYTDEETKAAVDMVLASFRAR